MSNQLGMNLSNILWPPLNTALNYAKEKIMPTFPDYTEENTQHYKEEQSPKIVTSNYLAFKLCKVMKSIGGVKKKGYNAFHKYNYVTEADLLDAVRDKLADAGIFMSTSVEDIQTHPIGEKGSALTTVRCTFTFIDSETGDTLSVKGAGQGADSGDKGVYKAITGAVKYAISKNFLIVSGVDDPEADEGTDREAYEDRSGTTQKSGEGPKPRRTKKTTEAASRKPLDKFLVLVGSLPPTQSYKDFFGDTRGKEIPSLEVIQEWKTDGQMTYLDKVNGRIAAFLAELKASNVAKKAEEDPI
jgi:ERF superfamily protein